MTSELSSYTWQALYRARARIDAEMDIRLAHDPHLGYTEALYAWCDPTHTLDFSIVDMTLSDRLMDARQRRLWRQCIVLHVPPLETTFTMTRRTHDTTLKHEASRVIQFHHDATQHTWSTLHWRYSTRAQRKRWIHIQDTNDVSDAAEGSFGAYYTHVLQSVYFKMISSHFDAFFETLCRYHDDDDTLRTRQNGSRAK